MASDDSGHFKGEPGSGSASGSGSSGSSTGSGDGSSGDSGGGSSSSNSSSSSSSSSASQSQPQIGKLGKPKKVLLKIKSHVIHIEELNVKVKMSTTWEKVFTAFAQHAAASVSSLRFLIDGERINMEETPTVGDVLSDITEEEAAEGIQIDTMQEQLGG